LDSSVDANAVVENRTGINKEVAIAEDRKRKYMQGILFRLIAMFNHTFLSAL
tara:strand:+ start:28 stop:183 length:156 start_codon:yes stop_codon:yes gene_type:complete